MINQLRLYDVDPGLEDIFLERFHRHACRIMTERHGFRILAMWMAREEQRLRFVYLLSWANIAEMKARWAAFMADAEWERIKQESRVGRHEPVRKVEDITLEAAPFSHPL